MDPVAEIKSRISIDELVGQYVQLKKVGRNFKALCPFHKERTPSFYVNPERQMAYCFGCRKGGDHFSFLQEIEGLDFRAALEMLAERAGITLPKISQKMSQEIRESRDRILELHTRAAAYFSEQLWNSKEGEKVLAYIRRRGLSDETIKAAGIGFALDHFTGLFSFLLGKGFTRTEILQGGLAIARDTHENECIDRFRMRLMFPIEDDRGRVCAFGGRAIREGDEPKYLNSPEHPFYQKSSILYGFFKAKNAIREAKTAVIMEGYMDLLAAHQAGVKHAVACSGTALTESQLLLLRRSANQIILSFDRDAAGKLATNRSLELALRQEFSAGVAVWKTSAKDPDECLRETPEAFLEAVCEPQSGLDYLLNTAAEQHNLATIDGKKAALEFLLPFCAALKNALEVDEWLKAMAGKLATSPRSLYDELKRYQGKMSKTFRSFGPDSRSPAVAPTSTKTFQAHEYFLGLLLTYPRLYSSVSHIVTLDDFENIELQNIYRSLTTQYNQSSERCVLTEAEKNRADLIAMYAESRVNEMDDLGREKEVVETARNIRKFRLYQEKHTQIQALKQVTSPQERAQLLDRYQTLLDSELHNG